MTYRALAFCALLVGCGSAPHGPTPPSISPSAAAPTEAYVGPQIRVAVGAFDVVPDAQKLLQGMGWHAIGATLTEQLTTGLVKTGRVTVLERTQIKKVIGNTQLEKEGDMSRYFDQKTTVKSGKLQGAQAILVGSVTQFEPNVAGAEGGIDIAFLGGLKHHKDKAVVGIDARLVDAETGKVLHAAHGVAEIISSGTGAHASYKGLKLGASAWSRTPLGEASREAANKALKELVEGIKQMPFEASVVSVSGAKVFIDAGSEVNLKVGDRLQVVHRGAPIKGPDGTVLGYDETLGGWITISSVQPKMSITTVEGNAPKAGDRVRMTP